ncbi:methyl-accepting chemotaxis protein [Noviherbaspirillum malthae]|jgi:methyl-accepting chemotaxis protein|uniref:methyl-accepting chemotaxis protein n=1 Tax=Noviherbaspirillum malthae TaxID=1260987 RepID=UPI00188F08D6|nr:methyl-accepting chemotaxis protein [Noviherbaspirillum malthae]
MFSWRTHVGTRLLFAFAIILTFLTFTTGLSVWRLFSVNSMAKILVNDKLANQRVVAEWDAAVSLNATRVIAIAKSDSLELGDYFDQQLKAGERVIADHAAAARKGATTAEERTLIDAIVSAAQTYAAVRDKIFQLKEIGRTQEVEQLVGTELGAAQAAYESALQRLLDHHKQQADNIAVESEAVFKNSVFLLFVAGGIAVLVGIGLAVYLTRNIVRPVTDAANLARRVAAGDLTSVVDTDRGDEIGILLHALFQMNQSLSEMASEIKGGVTEIDRSLSEIAHDNEDLAVRTALQADSLRGISVAMDALTDTVDSNAEATQQAKCLADAAKSVAGEGSEAVASVVSTMDSIQTSSKRIADIISVIDGIAFQTNILALNAAVEAARAGDHGRGFAVVAAEVRSLSQRSSVAAKEIRELITVSVNEVVTGTGMVDQAGITMAKVVDSINQVTEIVARINVASQRQAEGLGEIRQSIVGLDSTTEQNTALVKDAVRALGELTAQSQRVATSVSRFRT